MNKFERADFEATHWSIVLAAAQGHSSRAEVAMEELCRAYWPPLAVFLLRQGYTPGDAEDLTQSFFAARILTRSIFKGAVPDRGKFRSWLLASFQNYLRNEWDRRTAQKRGGHAAHVSLEDGDVGNLETEAAREPVNSAQLAFDRAFSLALLDRALSQLRTRYDLAGKGSYFDAMRAYLPGGTNAESYTTLAERFGKTEDAIKVSVSRLRAEFGQVVKAEVLRTVSNPEEAREELRYFVQLWSQTDSPL